MGQASSKQGGSTGRLQPLHGGRHNLPADVVAFNQRERLLAAMASVVAEHGYNQTTVAMVTAAAAVSRRTFYENFDDKEACFLAAYGAVDDYLIGQLTEVVRQHAEWPDQVAAILRELTRFLAAYPHLARLYLVEASTVGAAAAGAREESVGRLIALLAAGRAERRNGRELAEGIEEALVGGVMTLFSRRVRAGETEQLEDFAPAAIEFALAPYLGLEEARRVASSAD